MGNRHDKKIANLKVLSYHTCGLYYKPITIVNDDSGNTKGGSITVLLTSYLTGLESAV